MADLLLQDILHSNDGDVSGNHGAATGVLLDRETGCEWKFNLAKIFGWK